MTAHAHDKTPETSEPTVVSVERSLIILDLLAEHPEGLGTREISRSLGYGSGTTQKILNTLRGKGVITKRPDSGAYVFGIGAVKLAHQILAQTSVSTIGRPYLVRLAEMTGESAYLGVRQGDSCIYIDKVLSEEEVRSDAPLGARRPLNCTAVGKALLAASPDGQNLADLQAMANRGAFAAPTGHSLTEPEDLLRELDSVRERGYAVDDREFNAGGACVAAFVVDQAGTPVAALTASGPAERFDRQREELADIVRQLAGEMSEGLGYSARGSR